MYLPSMFVFIVIALIIVAGLVSLPWTPAAVVVPIVIGVLVRGSSYSSCALAEDSGADGAEESQWVDRVGGAVMSGAMTR